MATSVPPVEPANLAGGVPFLLHPSAFIFHPFIVVLRTHRVFLILCVLILVNQLGFGLITPVLPLYAEQFGLGPSLIGVVIGAYGLARFLVNVPAGRLAEARGRRPVLIAGTLLSAVAALLMATAQNLPQI